MPFGSCLTCAGTDSGLQAFQYFVKVYNRSGMKEEMLKFINTRIKVRLGKIQAAIEALQKK